MEIAFNPADKPGFTPRFDIARLVYEVTEAQACAYFTCVDEPLPADRYHFLGIDINRFHVDYRNYFVDLIQDLRFAPETRFVLPSPGTLAGEEETWDRDVSYGGNGVSFRLDLLLEQGR